MTRFRVLNGPESKIQPVLDPEKALIRGNPMPTYTYQGQNMRTRDAVSGERAAKNENELRALLRRERIGNISIRQKSAAKSVSLSFGGNKVKSAEIALFTRQFSVMLGAGLPLVQALQAIGSQNPNPMLKDILDKVRTDVEAGSTLAEALEKHPKVFDSLYTNMIAAGEAGGILDTVLQRLSMFIEKIVKLKKALKSALIYPSAIITVAIGVVALILWKVIPVFATMFESFDTDLPLLTRIVIAASGFLGTFAIPILVLIAVGIFGIKKWYQTNTGRRALDGRTLKIPVLGDVVRKISIARFTRTLATLLTSGVPILEALDITAKTAGNAILEDVILVVRKHIEEGRTMANPMRQSKFFPPMVTQMVDVGESTGELDSMLTKVADYYEEEADMVVANLLTLLEPVIIVFLGGVVGGIVIAMYLPMFKLISTLSG
jgi:type IV pilus assembly protein PilC